MCPVRSVPCMQFPLHKRVFGERGILHVLFLGGLNEAVVESQCNSVGPGVTPGLSPALPLCSCVAGPP